MAIKTRNIYLPASLTSVLLASAMFFGAGSAVSAQTPTGQTATGQDNARQQAGQDQDRQYNRQDPDNDITRRDLAEMDHFLDSHPEVAEQLRKDPSLINNRDWVANHPALQEYLQKHPGVREEFSENPNAFMHREERYDRREDERNITRRDVVDMDHFLDGHPEIAEQLRKDPSLIDNKQWVANHPALQEYMQSHPVVSDAFRSNPKQFMADENRYDRNDDGKDRGYARNDQDRDRGLASFGQFLGGHSNVAAELSTDPTLANNKEYLASHPELNEYLKAHPGVSQQLADNPQAVMSSNMVQQGNGFSAKPVGPTQKPKSNAPNPNQ
jgi:hypothetical protein